MTPAVTPVTPAVTLIVLSDRMKHLAVFLSALMVQTRTDWECLVLNQGTGPLRLNGHISYAAGFDARVRELVIRRRGDWGQADKAAAVGTARGRWVAFPNDDAYYCPRFLELMLDAGDRAQADLVMCDWVSAADLGTPYQAFAVAPRTGYIDVGGFLVTRERILAHGWPDRGPTGDGALIESLVATGARPVRVPSVLYVKN